MSTVAPYTSSLHKRQTVQRKFFSEGAERCVRQVHVTRTAVSRKRVRVHVSTKPYTLPQLAFPDGSECIFEYCFGILWLCVLLPLVYEVILVTLGNLVIYLVGEVARYLT